jgi:uroporphyrinogen-III synthase
MTPFILIRPEPACTATQQAAHDMGLAAHTFPMFQIIPQSYAAPDPGTIDALVLGSANALRHFGPAIDQYRNKPAYAVGETTANAARASGLNIIATGNGGLQNLLPLIHPDHRRLLRVTGANHVPLTPPPHISITTVIAYASQPLAMPPALAQLLQSGAVIALHSAEAARHFAAECTRLHIPRNLHSLITLGPRISAAAATGWAALHHSETPTDKALLVLAGQLCQTLPFPDQGIVFL